MRIDAPKSVAAPLVQGQDITSANNDRVPRNLVSQHGATGALPPLELGQELDALVLEELDGGRLLVKIGATLIEADGPGGLGAGQQVRLRVEQLQPTSCSISPISNPPLNPKQRGYSAPVCRPTPTQVN